jgi:hypothetical protein
MFFIIAACLLRMYFVGFFELSFPMMLVVLAFLTFVAFGLGMLVKKIFSKKR